MNTFKRLFTILIAFCPFLMYAQLKVDNSGKVSIGHGLYSPSTNLSVGDSVASYGSRTSIAVGIDSSSVLTNIGISSLVKPSIASPYLYNIGVLGAAGKSLCGGNYGIMGTLYNGAAGIGVFGSIGYLLTPVVGQYAGLFDGQVLATGEIRANCFVSSSDARLKTNIESFALEGKALEKVLDMDVVSYNYKERKLEKSELDTTDYSALREFNKEQAEIRHYGLLAQDLQKIYPNLVYEGQDGYLGINYVELVPVLIRSIQELKQELDEVKGGSGAKTRSGSDESADFSSVATGNVLYQNTPNPFKEQTTIRFSLADGVQDASICIFDMTGKTIKKLPISSGMDSVSVGGYELGEGMFLYSLIVNGQVIDTKRMVISKQG